MASNWTDLEEHTAIVEAVGKRCARERRVSLEFLDAGVSSHQNVGIRK